MSDSMGVNQLLNQMRTIREASSTPLNRINDIRADTATPQASPVNFGDVLKQSVDAVNQVQQASGAASSAFSRGDESVSLPEVMIAMQKSDVAFTAAVEVRNKLVEAYQEVMRMSV